MQYETVYDLAAVGYREWHGWVLAAGLYLLAGAFHAWGRRRGRGSPTAKVVAVFATVMLALGGLMTLWDYQRLAHALRAGTVLSVEGPVSGYWTREVEHYDPDAIHPYSWRTWEGFTVAGVSFGYWQDRSRAGFQNAEDRRLAIRDGMHLRIRFLEDLADDPGERRILRVEQAQADS